MLTGLQSSFDHLRASSAAQRRGEGGSDQAQHEAVTGVLSLLGQLREQLRRIEEKTDRLEGLAVAQVREKNPWAAGSGSNITSRWVSWRSNLTWS